MFLNCTGAGWGDGTVFTFWFLLTLANIIDFGEPPFIHHALALYIRIFPVMQMHLFHTAATGSRLQNSICRIKLYREGAIGLQRSRPTSIAVHLVYFSHDLPMFLNSCYSYYIDQHMAYNRVISFTYLRRTDRYFH